MKMAEENEKLISIDEFIARAKNFGVDFGKGNPRNRLRYYTKIGLLPHAKRKSFNNQPPNGAYPESVLGILLEIDKKIKSGKSIQEIKREMEQERERKKEAEVPIHILYKPSLPAKRVIPEILKRKPSYFPLFKKIGFLLLIIVFLSGIIFFSVNKVVSQKLLSSLLASLSQLVQKPAEAPAEKKVPPFSLSVEPYLTINAETAINAPLKVKEEITAPSFVLIKDEFEGKISVASLSADREYNFPDLSGTICLTTGNCIGLGGEVLSPGGTPNRLAKFIAPRRIANSSINDLYLRGVAITISSAGNVGIGMTTPRHPLHVGGRIQATGDVCTDLAGGKCLSELMPPSPPVFLGGGISGSGSTNYLSIWTGATTLGNSIIYQTGGKIGIGTTSPTQKLDVAGTIKMTGFQLPTNAASGYILTSDASGVGTWQPAPTGVLPSGTLGQTLRHDGTDWIANSFLYNSGSAIGIGTTSTLATLTLAGDGYFQGPLTIATTTLSQLLLQYDSDNYLKFSITSTSSEILASKVMMLNSLTGEIKFWNTSIKKGEYILRSSLPIFKFPVPSQTTSTTFVDMTREISPAILNAALPDAFAGAQRKFALLINFADDIPTSASSTWLVDDLTNGTDIQFEFAGQNLSELKEGVAHMSSYFTPPTNNWKLKVRVPLGKTIRIFNIFLLTYDQIL